MKEEKKETVGGQMIHLDEHSIALLRSGVYLASFTHALKSLLEISIRSGANTISSSIDPATGTICVDDNGVGIDTGLVNLLGRFDSNSLVSAPSPNQSSSSQKQIVSYLSVSQHRILDSLAHLSLLDICSRHKDGSYSHQTLFRDGNVIFSAPAKTSRRHSHGTTTTVRDLFHNLPVRQIRENDPLRHQQRLRRQWEESRLILQSLAIVYPHISFTLRNSSHQNLTSSSSNSSASFYRISKTGLFSSTFGKIFGQQFVQDSIPLKVSIDGFQVTGLFSKKRHSSRAIQLIYLDRVLIHSNSLVHRSLANLFTGLQSEDTSESPAPQTSLSTKVSPSKNGASSVDRHPVYLLIFTSLPKSNTSDDHDHAVHFLDEKELDLIPQTEEKINRIASQIFSQVFFPPKELPSSSNGQKKLQQESLFKRTLQSRWPVTKRPRLTDPSPPISMNGPQSISLTDRFSAPSKKHIDRSAAKSVHHKSCVPNSKPHLDLHKTKPKHLTKSLAHPPDPKPPNAPSGKSPSLHKMIPNLKSMFEYKPPSLSTHWSSTKADQKAYGSSQTMSFEPQDGKKRNQKHKFEGVVRIDHNEDGDFRIDLSRLADPSSFTIIGQLDLKFLIVKLDGRCSLDRGDHHREDGVMVAFDQHAVHERIRVERFLHDLCTGQFNVKELETKIDHHQQQEDQGDQAQGGLHSGSKFVPILVTRHEFDGLVKFKKLFNRWGFIYELTLTESDPIHDHNHKEDDEDDDVGFKQIFMRAVPEIIWHRFQCNDGRFEVLKNVLKGCLGFFEDRSRDHNLSSSPSQPNSDWFGAVKDCPSVLVQLLNSKACRGSIMFGDKLTNQESRKLLTELGRTRLPFSCAHGRPTCHPLFKFGEPPPTSPVIINGSSSHFDQQGHHPLAFTDRSATKGNPPPSPPLPRSSSADTRSPFSSPFMSARNTFRRRKINWESLSSG
ncbi:DNA mismatch repair protein [Puccinia graminis f. sp. tritici]|uniref:DNA mismatch repair protein n=1 Tax=Puccinia graminis f. sp. tritici TaxID=56615 RepID=A0A5B0PL16_PUCGR|nr:DNA mismatch repair protein [Puccinia graminis f. sp. tritici]